MLTFCPGNAGEQIGLGITDQSLHGFESLRKLLMLLSQAAEVGTSSALANNLPATWGKHAFCCG